MTLERHIAAMVAMARGLAAGLSDVSAACGELTEGCARGMEVDRCSVWRFEGDAKLLRLVDLYDARADAHLAGTVLNAVDYPAYFREMWTGQVVDAHRAQEDPRTAEFRAAYLEPLGILSMLDVPLKGPRGLLGVLCNEHRRLRTWTRFEVRLATFTACMATVVMDGREARGG